MIWPGVAESLASAAKLHNIPFCLSGFATVKMETIAAIAGEHAWYQHYMCSDDSVNKRFISRALDCGYKKLIITVDIPTVTRRNHNIKNGLSVPPQFNIPNIWNIVKRPKWAMASLANGIPRFENFTDLIPKNSTLKQTGFYLQHLIEGHVALDRLRMIREHWPHQLIVKGLMSDSDTRLCVEWGVDGIVLSNHGSRQLDATGSPLHQIQAVRTAVGTSFPLIVDGGAMSGLDVMRYIASGADFVLMGRAFMYTVASMGRKGADHVMQVLFE